MPDGLILAAGAGSRFGAVPKQLAFFRGKPMVQWALDALCEVTELERVVLVLGAYADMVSSALQPSRAEIVMCDVWSHGQSESLRAGLEALAGSGRVVITLGDQPLVSAAAIRRVLASGVAPARASYDGAPGHPVLLGPEQISAASRLSGDEGARSLLADAQLIPCDALGSGADVDTPEDLARLTGEHDEPKHPKPPGDDRPFVMGGFRELSGTSSAAEPPTPSNPAPEPGPCQAREYPDVVPPPVLRLNAPE